MSLCLGFEGFSTSDTDGLPHHVTLVKILKMPQWCFGWLSPAAASVHAAAALHGAAAAQC